ncbi:hypothetical protein [Maribellus sediminis]|uniref:NigD1/NigD2 family lipoprotein n=1 Tax=Maribellus sediminis TaxID=2696285 RepID=UPI00143111B0|nr:NigD-like C-terminal domain-containing protein [Maribellus sediminis]
MKKIAFVVLAVLSVAFFSCNDDDGYSLGDYWLGFGIIKIESDNYSIILDDGDELQAVAWNVHPDHIDWLEDGGRVLVNFTILDDVTDENGDVTKYLVKVNDISDILMKGILDITEENADSIGNDPIIVQEYWMTDSLLNFKLRYAGYSETHFLNLVQDPTDPVNDDGDIKLELRHNANDDQDAIYFTAYVSFSLNQLRQEGTDVVKIEISSTDYEEVTHTFSVDFDYSNLELPNQ